MAVHSAKVKSMEDTKGHVSGEFGAPLTSPFLLLSTKVTKKEAAR